MYTHFKLKYLLFDIEVDFPFFDSVAICVLNGVCCSSCSPNCLFHMPFCVCALVCSCAVCVCRFVSSIKWLELLAVGTFYSLTEVPSVYVREIHELSNVERHKGTYLLYIHIQNKSVRTKSKNWSSDVMKILCIFLIDRIHRGCMHSICSHCVFSSIEAS